MIIQNVFTWAVTFEGLGRTIEVDVIAKDEKSAREEAEKEVCFRSGLFKIINVKKENYI